MPTGAAPSLDLEGDGEPARRQARPRPTVPEYLREPRKRPAWLPVAAAAVLAVCLTLVVLLMFGLLEPGTPLGDMLVRLGVRTDSRQVAAETEARGRGERGDEEKRSRPTSWPRRPPTAPANEPAKSVEATSKPPAEPAKQPRRRSRANSLPRQRCRPERQRRPRRRRRPSRKRKNRRSEPQKEPEAPPSVTAPKLPPKSTTPPEAKPPAAPDDTARRRRPLNGGTPGAKRERRRQRSRRASFPRSRPSPWADSCRASRCC